MSDDRLERIERDLEKLTRVIIGNGSGDGLHERMNQLHDDVYGGSRGREFSLFSQVGRIRDNIEQVEKHSSTAREELDTRIDELAALFSSSHARVVGILKQIRAAVVGGIIASIVVLIVVAVISGNSDAVRNMWDVLSGVLGIIE